MFKVTHTFHVQSIALIPDWLGLRFRVRYIRNPVYPNTRLYKTYCELFLRDWNSRSGMCEFRYNRVRYKSKSLYFYLILSLTQWQLQGNKQWTFRLLRGIGKADGAFMETRFQSAARRWFHEDDRNLRSKHQDSYHSHSVLRGLVFYMLPFAILCISIVEVIFLSLSIEFMLYLGSRSRANY